MGRPGCFKIRCAPDRLSYDVFISDLKKSVKKLGTYQEGRGVLTAAYLKGNITCAPPQELCGEGAPFIHSKHTDAMQLFDLELPRPMPELSEGRLSLPMCASLVLIGLAFVMALRLSRVRTIKFNLLAMHESERPEGSNSGHNFHQTYD